MHLLEVPLELTVLHLRFAVDGMLQFGEYDFIPLLLSASVSHGECFAVMTLMYYADHFGCLLSTARYWCVPPGL